MQGGPLGALRVFSQVVGQRVILLLGAAVSGGIVLGLVEIAMASALYAVLVHFGLLAAGTDPVGGLFGTAPVAALLAIAVIATGLRVLNQLLPPLAAHTLGRRLRGATMFYGLSGAVERTGLSVAEVTHILFQVNDKTGSFVQSVTTTVTSVFLILLTTAGLVTLSPQLTVLTVAAAAIAMVPVIVLRKVYARYADSMYAIRREFSHLAVKATRNISMLRMMGANEQELAKITQYSDLMYDHSKKFSTIYALSGNIPQLFGIMLVLGIIFLNNQYELATSAAVVKFIYLLNRTVSNAAALSTVVGQIRENLPFYRELRGRAEALFRPSVEGGDSSARARPDGLRTLEVRSLSVGRREAVVSDISLRVGRGDTVLITGESGRGKTTLLATLVGVTPRLGGEILWDGRGIDAVDVLHLRKFISYAGPDPYLIEGTIAQNLEFGTARTDIPPEEMREALICACAEFVFETPGGLAHHLAENGEGISAGQKQRLALARCLLRRPAMLFLDEATANIDEDTEEEIMARIRRTLPDAAIIAVSHRSSMKRYASAIVPL